MAMISQAEAKKLAKKAEKKEATLARLRAQHKNSIESATRTAVTMGGAFGMAWWTGRYPDRNEILGMDASLVVGGALTMASLMGWAGKQDVIVESLGTGALSYYAATRGFQMGQEAAQEAA